MLFNSLEFVLFFAVVLSVYWALRSCAAQNAFLLAASYFFYGWWDYRFLALILASSLLDFHIGRSMNSTTESRRRLLLTASIAFNMSLLGYFKYCNFFIDSWVQSARWLGFDVEPRRLSVILPVGISFYTFQTLSYTIDVFRRRIQPTNNLVQFLTFVSFFPQLVAGPIERASNLLPQFATRRTLATRDVSKSFRLVLWGLFKKMVVADNISLFVDPVYADTSHYPPLIVFLATVLFGLQIYCDFSGYSDIAIGTARLLGVRLMTNFRTPYFATSVQEFWSRWHISLSTWFRDYVYIPLGGNRLSPVAWSGNITFVFLLSGLWHGANWTFVIWGSIHGIALILERLLARRRSVSSLRWATTMAVVFLGWIFFRAESVSAALGIVWSLVCEPWNTKLSTATLPCSIFTTLVISLASCVLVSSEWLSNRPLMKRWFCRLIGLRWSFYTLLVVMIALFGRVSSDEFIYFQF